jgi:hypothetical protein
MKPIKIRLITLNINISLIELSANVSNKIADTLDRPLRVNLNTNIWKEERKELNEIT